MTEPQIVLDFWFNELTPQQWFNGDEADRLIAERFATLHQQATAGELCAWRETIHGRLAEIIVLDQFSRNLFRHSAKAFAADGMALVLAQEALKDPQLTDLSTTELGFLYLPFMHSEVLADQERSVRLYQQPGLEDSLRFARHHRDLIARFGRFPHRNATLGRESSEAERAFLTEPGSRF